MGGGGRCWMQGVLWTRRGGSNRSLKGCEGPLRGHNPTGGARHSRDLTTSGVRDATRAPTHPHTPSTGRGRAGGALFVDVKRQQSTNKAPEARHRTQQQPSPPQAQRRDAPRRRRQPRTRRRKAQRRASPAPQQTGTCGGAAKRATASEPRGGKASYVGGRPSAAECGMRQCRRNARLGYRGTCGACRIRGRKPLIGGPPCSGNRIRAVSARSTVIRSPRGRRTREARRRIPPPTRFPDRRPRRGPRIPSLRNRRRYPVRPVPTRSRTRPPLLHRFPRRC